MDYAVAHTTTHTPPRIHHRAGGIPGDMALVFLLCRLAHPFRLKTLEYIFGWHKNRIGRWTNWLIQWIFDEWGHLLDLNLERFRREAPKYAAAFGRRLGYEEVDRCRNILQVDGCFMCVLVLCIASRSCMRGPYSPFLVPI